MVSNHHPHSHVATNDRPKAASHPQWHLCPRLSRSAPTTAATSPSLPSQHHHTSPIERTPDLLDLPITTTVTGCQRHGQQLVFSRAPHRTAPPAPPMNVPPPPPPVASSSRSKSTGAWISSSSSSSNSNTSLAWVAQGTEALVRFAALFNMADQAARTRGRCRGLPSLKPPASVTELWSG